MKLRSLIVAALALLLAACSGGPALVATDGEPTVASLAPTSAPSPQPAATPAPAPAAQRTIVDGAGRTLSFTQPPERIVCLYSRCLELLAALELEPVGIAEFDAPFATNPAYFPQPNRITIIPNDGDTPDFEAIAALQPDLVLGWEELVAPLDGVAPVYSVRNDLDSYQKSHDEIRAFAALLGREEIAERTLQAALDRLAAYQARAPRDRSVMYGFFFDGAFSYRDGQSGTCSLLKAIARCDWADPANASSWSVQVNDEALLQLDPDVLLVDAYGFDGKSDEQIIAELSARPLWAELTAVQTGRLFVSRDSVANMDGMGSVGMRQLLDVYAPKIYPELFPQALSDAEVQASVSGGTPAGPISVVDGAGTTHSFDAPPTRVVCYYNSCYGMLATLGVKPVAQAVNPEMLSDPIYFDGQGTDIPTLRRDGDAVDLEDVAAAAPDLVLVFSPEEAQALDGIAPAFQEFETSSLEDVYAALRSYGTLLGREAQAEAAIAGFERRLAAYAARSPKDVSVLKLGLVSPDAFSIATRNDPICQILSQVARCDWDDPAGDSGLWSYDGTIESLLALDPDVIILNNWTQWGDTALDDATLRAELAKNPLWQELRAVKANRVLSTPGYDNPIASSLPAATKFLDIYMPLLYPEQFRGPLSEAEVQTLVTP